MSRHEYNAALCPQSWEQLHARERQINTRGVAHASLVHSGTLNERFARLQSDEEGWTLRQFTLYL